ncbi:MAG TPA: 50S ribosomal protein L22 [Candidatus Polarisedimenticolia bacterium]|nr:50S ribosomal protein L22 [Candidatus Polarisedimenticolia bacterium]
MMTAKAGTAPPVAEATLRFYRCSAQKARLVIDQIRGRDVNEALGLLHFSPKGASRAIEKLLKSAVANAERGREKVDVDTLCVGEAYVGPGPSFRRVRGRAFGRAFRILHRTCHITVKLRPKRAVLAAAAPAPAPEAQVDAEAAAPAAGRRPAAKRRPKAKAGAKRAAAPARKKTRKG